MEMPALILAASALVFTIASFWWLHARVGTLEAFEPGVFSGYVEPGASALRLPVLLFNHGPVPIVVSEMRLRFDEATTEEPMSWRWTRDKVDPVPDDVLDAAQAFGVPGRSTHSLAAEFVGDYPGGVPEARSYRVLLEARTSRTRGRRWERLVGFTLAAGNLKHPSNYITYSNDADYLTVNEQVEAREALDHLRSASLSAPCATT